MAGKVQTAARPERQAGRPAGTQDIREQQMPKKKKKARHFYDYSLLFCIIFLTSFGLVMIYSASSYSAQLNYKGNGAYFMERQAMIAAAGFVGMLIISKIDYHIFARFSVAAYLMSYILMIAVSFVGKEVNGKKRWLPLGPFSFQPTEFVKIALIVLLAAMITTMGMKINKWKNMGYIVALTLPIAGLVAMNNLSSGIIVCGIAFVMLFVACKVKWPFFTLGALGLGTLAFAGPIGKFLMTIKLLQPYQFRRIEAWLNPESDPTDKGFQVLQGLYAIGSGGFFGKGLGNSTQKLGMIPEAQNDMILSVICEELGVFGAIVVLILFGLLLYRLMFIARNAPDLYGSLIAAGIFSHIALQVILNIAVVTGLIPTTGVTLPFISYGGTAVVFLLAEMGIALGISSKIELKD